MIDALLYLSIMTVALGLPFLIIGGIVQLVRRLPKPPHSAMRDWRDAHINRRG